MVYYCLFIFLHAHSNPTQKTMCIMFIEMFFVFSVLLALKIVSILVWVSVSRTPMVSPFLWVYVSISYVYVYRNGFCFSVFFLLRGLSLFGFGFLGNFLLDKRLVAYVQL